MGRPRTPPALRFWVGIGCGDGCWEWVRFIDSDGYGHFWNGDKQVSAHRWVYEAEVGLIPPDMTIDHLCLNRACVRPDHLEVVTNVENVRRGISFSSENAARTHCVNGHPFSPENTRRRKGRRECLACVRARDRVYARDRYYRHRRAEGGL